MKSLFLAASFATLTLTLTLASPALAQTTKPATVARDKLALDKVGLANQAAIRGASDASLVGALHEFAYERGALFAIQASPSRITDIALQPGEALLSVSAGDTTRWIVGDAHSGTGPTTQVHILVKPNAAHLATNLVIMTDRRVYHVELTSVAGPAMAAVSWRYPADLVWQNRLPPPAAAVQLPAFSPEALNLHYRISGDKPAWRPLAAFDDGHQVFIEMPPAISRLEAPPLFVIGDDGAELVNYRVQGRYYVVDRLFTRAQLRLGSGRSARTVTIARTNPITGPISGSISGPISLPSSAMGDARD